MGNNEARYSGPNRLGVCICGHSWDHHHLGMVMRQDYIDETHESYIPQECCHYGNNEVGGLKYNELTEEWEEHCLRYIDLLNTEEIANA